MNAKNEEGCLIRYYKSISSWEENPAPRILGIQKKELSSLNFKSLKIFTIEKTEKGFRVEKYVKGPTEEESYVISLKNKMNKVFTPEKLSSEKTGLREVFSKLFKSLNKFK